MFQSDFCWRNASHSLTRLFRAIIHQAPAPLRFFGINRPRSLSCHLMGFARPAGRSAWAGSRCASCRRQQRDVHVHLVLAHGRRRAVRHVEHGVLHRRDRRERDRQGRAVVHSGRAAVQLRDAGRVHRELRAVRARRRVSHRQRKRWAAFGPRRPSRRCCSTTCSPARSAACRPGNTSSAWCWKRWPALFGLEFDESARANDQKLGLGGHCLRRHALLLPPEPARHSRVERQGAQDHDRHDGDGRHHAGLERRDARRSADR